MKSPFAIFRKHQRTLTVVLTGLAMFAFIIMGSMDPSSRMAPVVVCAAVGAGLFWIFGLKTGTQNSKAVLGLMVGLIIGLLLPRLGGPAAAVETNAGSISREELQNLVRQRQIANQFLNAAYSTAIPMPSISPEIMQLPEQFRGQFINMQMQQWENTRRNIQFSFGQPTPQRDAVMGYLYRNEADRLGIVISDEAINDYIERITNDKLTPRDFNKILREMRVGSSDLYDILRDELKARNAFQLLVPRVVTTPEKSWDYYRKFNVRQQLEAAAIPVEAFTSEIPDPSTTELQAFFEKYKDRFPTFDGEPGFRQPRRVELEYLEADYETIESHVPPVTDEEIETFYNENKELYRTTPASSSPNSGMPPGPATNPAAGSGNEAAKDAPVNPEFTPETDKPSDANAPKEPAGNEPPAAEKPAAEQPTPKSPPAGDTPAKPQPAPNGDAPADETPAEPQPAAPQPEQSDAPEKSDAPAAPEENGEEAATEFFDAEGVDPQFAQLDNDAPAAEEKEQPPAEQTTAEQPQPAASTEAPAAPQAQDATAATPAEPAQAKPAEEAPAQEQPAREGRQAAGASSEVPPPPLPQTAGSDSGAAATPPAPEYRPLDDDLRSEIRDQLLRQKTFEVLRGTINEVHASMLNVGSRVNLPEGDPDYLSTAAAAEELQRIAEEKHLNYVRTPLLSANELQQSEDYPVGNAVEPSENPFERNESMPVAYSLFSSSNEPVYLPKIAEDVFGSSRYAYWAVRYVAEHIPTFDEAGIKERVTEVWKREQARPLAEKRAKELLELVQKSESETAGLSEKLAEQTVTGEKDAAALLVRTTPEFTWLTQNRPTNAPLDPFQQQPVQVGLSEVPGIESAGNEFMKTVFNQLDNGEVGIAPNEDRTIYYLVSVRNRTPSGPSGREALRQQFLQEEFLFSGAFSAVAREDQRVAMMEWTQGLENKYEVQWNSEVFEQQ